MEHGLPLWMDELSRVAARRLSKAHHNYYNVFFNSELFDAKTCLQQFTFRNSSIGEYSGTLLALIPLRHHGKVS